MQPPAIQAMMYTTCSVLMRRQRIMVGTIKQSLIERKREKGEKRRSKERPRYLRVDGFGAIFDLSEYLQKRKLAESSDIVEPDSITAQSPMALQAYLASMQAKTFSTMSALELDDMQIPGMF
jgi:hypothetical protein